MKCLEDRAWRVRIAAVEAISQIVVRADERVAFALSQHIGRDKWWLVRIALIRVLPHIAGRGNQCAINAILGRFLDVDWSVRMAAIEVIPLMTERGDGVVIQSLVLCLIDDVRPVRMTAARALRKMFATSLFDTLVHVRRAVGWCACGC